LAVAEVNQLAVAGAAELVCGVLGAAGSIVAARGADGWAAG